MPANTMQTLEQRTDHAANGGRLVSLDGRHLPLKSAALAATATGGLARATLKQVFANPHQEPLQVTYTMPLPADGAVSGCDIHIGDRRISGEVKPRRQAREEFERALVEGRTAGLLDQERANLFTQQLGNVPGGQEVTVELTVDQTLAWLAEGFWEWRFPTVIGPRYLGAKGRVGDHDKVTVEVTDRPLPVRASLELEIGDLLGAGARPESPSHAIAIHARGDGTGVTLSAGEGARLDRDIVVRWAVPRPEAGVTLQSARRKDAAYGLLTIVPPESPAATLPRDLILLIDTSGSMHGDPLRQAKRLARAVIDSLQEADSLEMISFASEPRRWRRSAAGMSPRSKLEAHAWIDALRSGGGTEMRSAVEEALRPLRSDGVRQEILITDGYIGFESEVVGVLRRHLPANSRLHAVGVGSAVNAALLHPAARAGRGVEVIVGLDEDVERGAARLLAATRAPVVSDIHVDGDAVTGRAPRALPDLLAGAPVLASLVLRPAGGRITVRGRIAGGAWEQELLVPPAGDEEGNPAIARLYARETVEDLEIDLAAGGDRHDIDAAIERFGVDFQIATRLTSWVAVSDQADVDPGSPSRRRTVPQELPFGTSAEGLGLRPVLSADSLRPMTLTFDQSMSEEDALFDQLLLPQGEAPRSGRRATRFVSNLLRGKSRPPRVPRSFGERSEDDAAQEPDTLSRDDLAGLSDVPASTPAAKRVFSGRWIDAGFDDLQILEFEVTGQTLDWIPLDRVALERSKGAIVDADIDPARGTATGAIEAGCLVRLALRIARSNRDPIVAVILDSGDTRIRIEL